VTMELAVGAANGDWDMAFGEDGPQADLEVAAASLEAWGSAAHPFQEPPSEADAGSGGASGGVEPSANVSGTDPSQSHVNVESDGVRRVRRRLNVKTRPTEVDGNGAVAMEEEGGVDLLTRREAKAEAARHAAKRRRLQLERTAVEEKAADFVERRPHLLAWAEGGEEAPGGPHLADGPGFHPSHDVTLARTSGVAYCRVCAAWTRGLRTRLLRAPCAGVCRQKSLLRRLELDVEPCNGRIPSELKRPGARGSRGGR
jgi:hypothetical protein